MTSWRDAVSAEAQRELDALLTGVLPFARQQLDAHGAFFPYGMIVGHDREGRLVSAWDGDGDEAPAAPELLELLYIGVQQQAGDLRAAAFVAQVVVDGSDAIRVELEHREGAAIAVLLPYAGAEPGGGGVEYGELSAGPGEHQVWPSS
ncbi:hypothetical protein [Jiangella mangrovi]|uniref:Uncharacterized protein n=1 Tax=Jiangella mangrovi TaxID=1524084 RepID=A0A7W9LIY0_9ACTN|nr:hypothetical protein [Jiangella mangrovi]MBB5785458.1 hypothetical protein [Jiangella mangrovi]